MEILENIRINISFEKVLKRLHMERHSEPDEILHLVDLAQQLIEPKAAYDVCYIEEKSDDSVIAGGIRLSSRVLRKNLEEVERIFPFVITLGGKLGEKLNTGSDMLENFYLDTIGNIALNAAQQQLKKHLQSKYAIDKVSSMAPGSLPDWPIEEQAPLFNLLGDVETSVGVKLTSHLLMIPAKSVSGVYFPTEISFYSCQLCPRERCDSRKARYNEKIAQEYGIKR
jgi:hypothetical protein